MAIAGRCQPTVRRGRLENEKDQRAAERQFLRCRARRADLVGFDVERQVERCDHCQGGEGPVDDPGRPRMAREGAIEGIEQEDQHQRQCQERCPVERGIDRELRPEQRIGRQREGKSTGQPAEPALRPVGWATSLSIDSRSSSSGVSRFGSSDVLATVLRATRPSTDRTPPLPDGAALPSCCRAIER